LLPSTSDQNDQTDWYLFSHGGHTGGARARMDMDRFMNPLQMFLAEQVDLYTPIMAHCGPVPFLDKANGSRAPCSLCAPSCKGLQVHYTSAGYQFIAGKIKQAIEPLL
jgi:hypothetical protein